MTSKQLIEKHKKEIEFSNLRKQYRMKLIKAKLKCGNWIPFGYNLNLLKNQRIPINKEERYHSTLKYEGNYI